MPKYRVRQYITGAINGVVWPAVGEIVELERHVEGMVEAGWLELVEGDEKTPKTEKRPAPADDVETPEAG